MGGGGFTMEPVGGALDEFVLGLTTSPIPKICFLPTASGDPGEQIGRFHAAFAGRSCEPVHLSLFRLGAHPVDLRSYLLAQDIVYVGGGSMRNMLAIWRAHGLDEILRECWEQGTVLAGVELAQFKAQKAHVDGLLDGARPRKMAAADNRPSPASLQR